MLCQYFFWQHSLHGLWKLHAQCMVFSNLALRQRYTSSSDQSSTTRHQEPLSNQKSNRMDPCRAYSISAAHRTCFHMKTHQCTSLTRRNRQQHTNLVGETKRRLLHLEEPLRSVVACTPCSMFALNSRKHDVDICSPYHRLGGSLLLLNAGRSRSHR